MSVLYTYYSMYNCIARNCQATTIIISFRWSNRTIMGVFIILMVSISFVIFKTHCICEYKYVGDLYCNIFPMLKGYNRQHAGQMSQNIQN